MAPGFFPLDKELQLLPGELPPTLQAGTAWLGASVPFVPASRWLQEFAAVRVSAATVRRVTQRAGAALVASEDAAVAQIEQTLPPTPVGPPRQQVSVDGAMVPVRGGWREARTLAVAKLKRARGTRNPSKTTAISYFSRMTDAETFSQLATGELHRRGTERARLVAAVADGAQWCQNFFDLHCPQAVRILDFPHAVHYLHLAAQAVFGPESEAGRTWIDQQATTLREGDPAAVLAAVAALPVDAAPERAAATKTRDQVLAYLDARRSQMTYATFLAQGLPIGSGMVESANKLVVEARLKGAGMHWDPAKVDSMLSLRAAICSDRWAEAWTQLSEHWRCQRPGKAEAAQSPPPQEPEPASAPVRPPRPVVPTTPRPKTIVDGKPTADHPWKRPLLLLTRTTAM